MTTDLDGAVERLEAGLRKVSPPSGNYPFEADYLYWGATGRSRWYIRLVLDALKEAQEQLRLASIDAVNETARANDLERRVKELTIGLDNIKEQRERLLGLVREIEWLDVDEYGFEACNWCNNVKALGHAPDCRVAAEIGGRP